MSSSYNQNLELLSSRPLLSRSGCILTDYLDPFVVNEKFSSPFIEERLYLVQTWAMQTWDVQFSSPFIEERLYLG